MLKVVNGSNVICSSEILNENQWYTFTIFIGTSSDDTSSVYLNDDLLNEFTLNYTFDTSRPQQQ